MFRKSIRSLIGLTAAIGSIFTWRKIPRDSIKPEITPWPSRGGGGGGKSSPPKKPNTSTLRGFGTRSRMLEVYARRKVAEKGMTPQRRTFHIFETRL